MMEWLLFILLSTGVHAGFFFYFRGLIRKDLTSKLRIEEMKKEMGLLVAEINGTADRNITILEDRILKLEDLVRKADQRIRLMDGKREPVQDQVMKYREAVKQPAVKEEPADLILKLFKQGASPDAIAHEVGLSISEVNLIMKLQGVEL